MDVSELAGNDITVVENRPSAEAFMRLFYHSQPHNWVSVTL